MSDIIKNIKFDERDDRFIKLREKFTEEIKKNFDCENYDEVVKYVFQEVFENKMQKETCMVEFNQIFDERTEDYVNLLFDLAEQILGEGEEKEINEGEEKGLHNERQRKYSSKRGEGSYGNYSGRREGGYKKGGRDYYQQKERFYGNQNRRGGNPRGGNKIKIGNKEVILHNQRRRSRSRENSEDELKNENVGRYPKTYMEDYQEYPGQGFQGRGYYGQMPPRMYPPMMRGGKYMPYYPQMIPFMDMRR